MSLLQNITSEQTFSIVAIAPNQNLFSKVLGYYVTSTASINVEDSPEAQQTNVNLVELEKIAKYLINSSQPELVLHIHGYAVSENDAKGRYKLAYDYADSANSHLAPTNHVFVGYRWPAENPKRDNPLLGQGKPIYFLDKVGFAFQALPTLLLGFLISSLVFGFVAVLLLVSQNVTTNLILTFMLIFVFSSALGFGIRKLADATKFLPIIPNGLILVFFALVIGAIATLSSISKNPNIFLVPLILICILLLGLVVALIALRLSTYPRDRYRASNYGVIDLVRFFQYLEKAILDECKDQTINVSEWKLADEHRNKGEKTRIKISFIAHSLGCEVATQAIRILSDVFDTHALNKPTPKIGNVFSLGRLVLVAPDIPLETILSSRANYLKSSLRRCEEAYVFCNEADLALRLASTAANYFSFPFRTRIRGYKLGNVTFNRQSFKNKLESKNYGVVNCSNSNFSQPDNPSKYLEIRASAIERKCLTDSEFKIPTAAKDIADYFTFFDCTDYEDVPNHGLLSFSKKQSALNLWFDSEGVTRRATTLIGSRFQVFMV